MLSHHSDIEITPNCTFQMDPRLKSVERHIHGKTEMGKAETDEPFLAAA